MGGCDLAGHSPPPGIMLCPSGLLIAFQPSLSPCSINRYPYSCPCIDGPGMQSRKAKPHRLEQLVRPAAGQPAPQLLLDAQTEALLAGTRNWVWAFGRLASGWVISWCSAHGGRSGWTCSMSWIWRRHSGDGHGRLSAYAHGHARARAQPSAHTGGGLHARRGNRNACRFSASGTRRGG